MRYSTFVNKVMYSQKTPKKLAFYLQCVLVYIHWFGGSWGQGGGWYLFKVSSPLPKYLLHLVVGIMIGGGRDPRNFTKIYLYNFCCSAPMYAIEIHTTFQRKIFLPV